MSEWTRVDEMLPVRLGYYLCYLKRGITIVLHLKKYKNQPRKFYSGANNIPFGDVTHWMPLPEPPEQDND